MPASSSIVQWTCALEYLLDWMIFSIYFFDREWVVTWESCNLIGSESGWYSPDHGHGNQLR